MKTKLTIIILIGTLLLTNCRKSTLDEASAEPTVALQPTGAPEATTQAAASTEAATLEYTPVFESTSCPFELPAGQVQGRSVECGYLVVPEERSNPEGRQVRLAVAVFHHPDGASEPDPIIYLSGGPGASALELIHLSFDQAFAPFFAANRDIILLDQRGVGLSEPALDCPGLIELSLELMDGELDGGEVNDEQATELVLELLLACEADLNAIADLRAYNSATNAADVNDLRVALGYEQVNLWGTSYGTRLTLEVVRGYPEGVRSVVLDSVYPPDVDIYTEAPANMARAFDTLFDGCAADPGCDTAYPALRQVFFETVDQLDISPSDIHIIHPLNGKSYTLSLDGTTMLALLFRYLYLSEVLPLLPQIIYDANQGSYTMIAQIQGALLLQGEIMSHGMQFSVQCNEEFAFSSPEAFEAALAEYPELTAMFVNGLVGRQGYVVCEDWESGQAGPSANEPVTSDIPALVMAGEYDPITPPSWGMHAAETLDNGYFFEYPGVGHGASAVAGCPRDMLIAFLDDPTQEPDASCIGGMGIEFALPVSTATITMVPVTIEDFGIQAVVPDGWLEVSPEYYVSPDRTVELVIKDERETSQGAFLAAWSAADVLREDEIDGRIWTVYYFEIEDTVGTFAGLIAVTPSESGFYMVLIVSKPDKIAVLDEAILMPILEAFTISDL